jgi:amino acid transporter
MGDGERIGFFSLFIIIFSAVGSGPAGVEGIIGACGISLGLASIVVFPFLWGFVQALISAELSVKYKQLNGAVGAWTHQLFGRAAALNTSLWLVLMQCSTAAFVSEVTVAYAQAFWPGSFHARWQSLVLALGIIIVSVLINSVSIEFVSRIMSVFTLNAVAVFAVLVAYSIHRGLDGKRFDDPRKTARIINWSETVNLLVYNSAGYDASAAIVANVINPRRNVPAAMVLVGVAVAGLYAAALTFPYLATTSPAADWQPGYFVVVARELAGEWLAGWVALSCALTNLQVYLSALMTASHTVQSMAAAGIYTSAPGVGGLRLHLGAAGSPRDAIALCALLSGTFACAPLMVNLSLQSTLFVFIMLAECACFLRDNGEYGGALLISGRWARRLCILPPLALSSWILVVQHREVAAPLFGALAAVALWTMPRERAQTADEQVGLFYKQFDELSPDAQADVVEALNEGRPPSLLMPRAGTLASLQPADRAREEFRKRGFRVTL